MRKGKRKANEAKTISCVYTSAMIVANVGAWILKAIDDGMLLSILLGVGL